MGSTTSTPAEAPPPVALWAQKLPPLPKLPAQIPPQPNVDVRAAVENEVEVCAAWTADLHGHGCRVGEAADSLLSCGGDDITPAALASASATIGGDIQAHADASQKHGPRCLKALEWCAAAMKPPPPPAASPPSGDGSSSSSSSAAAAAASAASAASATAPAAAPPPAPLSPEVAARCAALRGALMAHHGLVSDELVPRLHVLQQVFIGAVNADKPQAPALEDAATSDPAK
jgi:hypothetical protein